MAHGREGGWPLPVPLWVLGPACRAMILPISGLFCSYMLKFQESFMWMKHPDLGKDSKCSQKWSLDLPPLPHLYDQGFLCPGNRSPCPCPRKHLPKGTGCSV